MKVKAEDKLLLLLFFILWPHVRIMYTERCLTYFYMLHVKVISYVNFNSQVMLKVNIETNIFIHFPQFIV